MEVEEELIHSMPMSSKIYLGRHLELIACVVNFTNILRAAFLPNTKHKMQIQSNLCIMTTLGILNLWPLLTGGRCSEVALCYKKWKMGPQNGGRCRQVVVIQGWSLAQVWQAFLYEKAARKMLLVKLKPGLLSSTIFVSLSHFRFSSPFWAFVPLSSFFFL